jgi:hypothetical protein
VLVEVHDMPVLAGLVSAKLLQPPSSDTLGRRRDVRPRRHRRRPLDAQAGRRLELQVRPLEGRRRRLLRRRRAARIRYVAPSKWKRDLGTHRTTRALPDRRAIELWPNHAAKFSRAKDDGRAEAALIAWWHLVDTRSLG